MKCKNFLCANWNKYDPQGCGCLEVVMRQCKKRKDFNNLQKAWKEELLPHFLNVWAEKRDRAWGK